MYPEECTGICKDGTAIDLMIKPGKNCPQNIDHHAKNQEDFIGDIYDICGAIVSSKKYTYG